MLSVRDIGRVVVDSSVGKGFVTTFYKGKPTVDGKLVNWLRLHDGFEWSDRELIQPEKINHPDHYGGEDNVYEAIKVIDAWNLNFSLGNCVKYIARQGKKGDRLTDLKKALWYLQHEVERLESGDVQQENL